MKIAIIGAGSIGSLFGGFLTQSGESVILVDKYAQRVDLLNESGLRIEGVSGEHRIAVKAVTNVQNLGPVDWVFVCVKAFDTQKAVEQHRALIGPDTAVLTLQNGMGNVERIAQLVGAEHVLGGTTAQGGYLVESGHLRHAGNGPTHIGELSGEKTDRLRMIVDLFNRAGFATSMADNIDSLIWTKLVINVGINALTALLRVNNGLTSAVEPARKVQKAAVDEALAVARAAGISLDAEAVAGKVVDVAKATATNVSSMLTDVLESKQTEIGFINGAVCRQGEKLGVPTPVNWTLTKLVGALEATYDQVVK